MVRLAELVRELGGRCEPPGGGQGHGGLGGGGTPGGGALGADVGGPEILDVRLDSREVAPGALFAALPGHAADGLEHVEEALARGARAVLAPEGARRPAGARSAALARALARVPWWSHPDPRAVAGRAAARVHGHPARSLLTVGVTGTNGKTTTAHLTAQLLARAGRVPGVVGTVGHRLADGELLPTRLTTPDGPELQRLARRQRELGGDSLVIEISSHALDQERTAGLELTVGVFTNLSRDHLDYHGTMEQYARVKSRMFTSLGPRSVAIVNADDPWHRTMSAAARESGAEVITYGTGSRVDLGVSGLRTGVQGSVFLLEGMGIPGKRTFLPLLGRHNVLNALAASAVVLWSGASPSTLVEGLATVTPPPGRMEPVPTGGRGFTVLVDYAHTEAALAGALDVLREALDAEAGPRGRGRLICVFGAGGDRDPGKRGPMGRAVAERADLAVVTTDNPRSEDPAAILEGVLSGARPDQGADPAFRPRAEVVGELDRRRAIRLALGAAQPGDVVLVAGKGHETTQNFGEGPHCAGALPFDDRQVVLEELP